MIFVAKDILWLPFWRHLVSKLDFLPLERGVTVSHEKVTPLLTPKVVTPFMQSPLIRKQISVLSWLKIWEIIFVNLYDCYCLYQCSQWGWYGCCYWASVAVTMGPYILSLAPSQTITKNGPIFVCLCLLLPMFNTQ